MWHGAAVCASRCCRCVNDASLGLPLSFYTDARVAHFKSKSAVTEVTVKGPSPSPSPSGLRSVFSLQQFPASTAAATQQQQQRSNSSSRWRRWWRAADTHGSWESPAEVESESVPEFEFESQCAYECEWESECACEWECEWDWGTGTGTEAEAEVGDASASIWPSSWAFRLASRNSLKIFENR